MELIGDGVVGGRKPGLVNRVLRHQPAPRRIAQLAHQVDVLRRVDQVQLIYGRGARRQQVGVLDETGGLDEVDRELDADGLQRMLIGQVVLHQRVAVDERNRSGHGHLR